MSTSEEILNKLVEVAHRIESHEAAVFLLKQEQASLRAELLHSDWQPPEVASS